MTAFSTLGIVLIFLHWNSFVSCQGSSSEEDSSLDWSKYQNCSNGFCVPVHLCTAGFILQHGENIISPRFQDYEDMVYVELEQKNTTCPFSTICCALKEGQGVLRNGPSEPQKLAPLPPSKCGINRPNGYVLRVNNSAIAQFGEFPWMAVLFKGKDQYFCGGSLIHPKVILTAAHCVLNLTLDTLSVRLGEWDTVTENEPMPHQQYGVQKMIVHEGYVHKKFHNDIALLIMEKAAELRLNVNTICLPPKNSIFDDQRCMASGWGTSNFDPEGKYSEVMKKVELPVVPRERCKLLFKATRLGWFFQLHKSILCGGGEEGVDVCKGDGGSPLACKLDDQYVQAGIVSWGLGCGDKDVPAGYTKITKFIDWIETNLSKEGINVNDR